MRVTAAIARVAGQPLDIVELELDEPRAGEVRVRMVATGVCHTDALVRDQVLPTPLPVVLGHEGAGVVEAVGEGVATVRPGDHVVLGFNSCGSCASCRSGHPAYCETFPAHNFGGARTDGTTSLRDGGTAVSSHFFGQSSFATFANVSERSVVKVPDTAPLDILGPLGCGLTTGAGAVLNVLRPDAGSSIVVFGTGAVGCSALLAAVVANCTTIVMVDIVQSRLELALELGATHIVNSRDEDAVEAVKRITGGGAQFALDTTGNARVFRQMVDSLAVRGHGDRALDEEEDLVLERALGGEDGAGRDLDDVHEGRHPAQLSGRAAGERGDGAQQVLGRACRAGRSGGESSHDDSWGGGVLRTYSRYVNIQCQWGEGCGTR